jgi:ubiquinone/menaquinone biosynthesis C-methylase UbiE
VNFYKEISSFYDDMINFSNRLESEKKIFKALLSRYPAKIVIDAGCGSGFHTILLSQLNLKATGLDTSESMLRLAESNSKKYHVVPSFVKSDFLSLNKSLRRRNDAVFCLGNSFVHLLTEKDQIRALINFREYLNTSGFLCLQIINYDKILKNKQKVFAVREINNQKITRMYSFHQKTITFTIKIESGNDFKESSTELYPIQSAEILTNLEKAGFDKTEIYGDLKLNPYNQYESENICCFSYLK